jgi:hypothetical protein
MYQRAKIIPWISTISHAYNASHIEKRNIIDASRLPSEIYVIENTCEKEFENMDAARYHNFISRLAVNPAAVFLLVNSKRYKSRVGTNIYGNLGVLSINSILKYLEENEIPIEGLCNPILIKYIDKRAEELHNIVIREGLIDSHTTITNIKNMVSKNPAAVYILKKYNGLIYKNVVATNRDACDIISNGSADYPFVFYNNSICKLMQRDKRITVFVKQHHPKFILRWCMKNPALLRVSEKTEAPLFVLSIAAASDAYFYLDEHGSTFEQLNAALY